MLTWPAAMFTIVAGMKKGDILRGPPCKRLECSRSMISNPPIPEPIKTPTRSAFSGVTFNLACSIASCVAAMAKWMKRPILRASFFSTKFSGSKFFTSAAKVTGKPVASNPWMGAMPLTPARRFRQISGAEFPTPQIKPRPVTTTLRVIFWVKALFASFRGLFVLLDVFDCVLHGLDLLGILVRDFQIEGFLKLHHQFNH